MSLLSMLSNPLLSPLLCSLFMLQEKKRPHRDETLGSSRRIIEQESYFNYLSSAKAFGANGDVKNLSTTPAPRKMKPAPYSTADSVANGLAATMPTVGAAI